MAKRDPVGHWVDESAARLTRGNLLPHELRERDLSTALKEAIEADFPARAKTIVLTLADWQSLGRSTTDVVLVDAQHSRTPERVFELKWCQESHDKVHEAIWDLFKVALLAREYNVHGYLVTGAPMEIWSTALCRDLFDSGFVSSADLLQRRFPNGRLIWDWMLDGGDDRYPSRVPTKMRTRLAGRATVPSDGLKWEIRAIEVMQAPGSRSLSLADGWPKGERPSGATHPLG